MANSAELDSTRKEWGELLTIEVLAFIKFKYFVSYFIFIALFLQQTAVGHMILFLPSNVNPM